MELLQFYFKHPWNFGRQTKQSFKSRLSSIIAVANSLDPEQLLQSLLTCSAEIQHAHRDLSSLTVVKRLMSIFSSIALVVWKVELIPKIHCKGLLQQVYRRVLCFWFTVFSSPFLFIRTSRPSTSWTSDWIFTQNVVFVHSDLPMRLCALDG